MIIFYHFSTSSFFIFFINAILVKIQKLVFSVVIINISLSEYLNVI